MIASTQASAVTQCPHCSAKFRVRAEQVKLHSGLVRCGACRGIFDAVEHLVEGKLPRNDPLDDELENEAPRTIIQGMPAMQESVDPLAKSAPQPSALGPTATPHALVRTDANASIAHTTSMAHDGGRDFAVEHIELKPIGFGANIDDAEPYVRNVDAAAPTVTSVPLHQDEADALNRYHWRDPERKSSPRMQWVYALLSLLAAVGLVAQGAYFFRDEIANRAPSLAPTLAMACEHIGCRVQPPKRTESLGFVGADLAADPAHKGLLIFTATLRNTGERTVAYPHLVLTLDGLGGEMVARRIFSPKEFAPANANLPQGLAGGAEIEIKLYLDASQANVVGFKVDHAYL
jgi:predicted Zn finger-like uncharacterized protein